MSRTRAAAPRACLRCHEVKDPASFPMGRSGKRRHGRCMACIEAEAHARDKRFTEWRATWVDPHSGRVVRRCSVCREVKDLERDFYRAKVRDGHTQAPNLPCKPCADRSNRAARERAAEDPVKLERQRALSRERGRRYQARHPEREAERNKRYWQRLKADPERYQKMLEDARINARLRREREGRPMTRSGRARMKAEAPRYLPVQPLLALVQRTLADRKRIADVLNDRSEATLRAVCADLGLSERRVRDWIKGKQTQVRIATAESALLAAGVEWHEVYSYDDHAAQFLGHEVPA